MKKLVIFFMLGMFFLTSCSVEKKETQSFDTIYKQSADMNIWQSKFRYCFVASPSSVLMQAGFSLENQNKVVCYRSGAELLALNSGNPVLGEYEITMYESNELVTTYLITDVVTNTQIEPKRMEVLPEIILRIRISKKELQKVSPSQSTNEELVYYGYRTAEGFLVLTTGDNNNLQVFISKGRDAQFSVDGEFKTVDNGNVLNEFPSYLAGTWTGIHPLTREGWSLTFDKNGQVSNTLNLEKKFSQIKRMIEIKENFFLLEDSEGNHLNLGILNIGGGVKYDFGLYINPDRQFIQPFHVAVPLNKDFDYDDVKIDVNSQMNLYRGDSILMGKSNLTYIPTVDTKNLSRQQLENWILATYALVMETTPAFYRDLGWTIEMEKANDGLVYAYVFDENNREIWTFRVNSNGKLESDGSIAIGDRGGGWISYGNVYYE